MRRSVMQHLPVLATGVAFVFLAGGVLGFL